MIVFDTDILSLLDRPGSHAFKALSRRLEERPDDERVCTTIITYEEQIRGWLSQISAARTVDAQIVAYGRVLRSFQLRDVLPFDQAAAATVSGLQKQRVRVGTMDLRIAAISLSNDALLISRNLRDFRRVPNLRVEDWTQPE